MRLLAYRVGARIKVALSTMHLSNGQPPALYLATGDVPLDEYRLRTAGRDWSILHTGAVLTLADEQDLFSERRAHLPYGVALWPSAIALAHAVAVRVDGFRGRTVLELGAGTGLPGIIAAGLGAHVVQTDGDAAALAVCQRNGARNHVATIAYHLAAWTAWTDTAQYEWILGADILYDEAMHPFLRLIFETQLAPSGRLLLADPFREESGWLLETLEANGWSRTLGTWRVGTAAIARSIGVYELVRAGR